MGKPARLEAGAHAFYHPDDHGRAHAPPSTACHGIRSAAFPLLVAAAISAAALAASCSPTSHPGAGESIPVVSPSTWTTGGQPSPTSGSTSSPSLSAALATTQPLPSPNPSPTSVFGCPSGPCPSSLQYAVNGCVCAGQTYVESQVTAQYCCKSGFSDSECPEALQQEALAESVFGSTAAEIEAQLVTVKLQGWPVRVHEKAAPAFMQAAAKIENMSYRIVQPPESYNRRDVGGHVVLSMHSFGIAVDINPDANPSCGVTRECRCYNDLVTDMPPAFIQAFTDSGFEWGGSWAEHPDPMHFEWAGWR